MSGSKITLSVILLLILNGCSSDQHDKLVFPYSQWTVGTSGHFVTWRFMEGFDYNDSFISAPGEGEWEEWYNTILKYRETVREKAGKESPALRCAFPFAGETKIHFDKFAYQLKLQPEEELMVSGEVMTEKVSFTIYIDFDLKTRGEEKGYVVRRQLKSVDSIRISTGEGWTHIGKNFKVPRFSTDSFAVVPILRIVQSNGNTAGEAILKEIRLHSEPTREREQLLTDIEAYTARQAESIDFSIPSALDWTHTNFVMGFVFVWDHTFWDVENGSYLVDEYCQTMEKEFGGLQSVVLWHSYPNIGIDEKNQFEFFHAMPGGIDGLKQVVADFQQNGVKVFLTYNPWDLDTRRPENHDFKELAKMIEVSGADGIYLDTWRSSKGVISIFDVENSIRDEASILGREVAFTTEILPEFKDLYGRDALTSSWGQEIDPFHFTDLSHQKWLMPEHKQYYISRMTKNRKPLLAHAWINGQGIQVWENIFGTMNLWSAEHRQWLRKMNAIWQSYGHIYLTDNWKPLIPLQSKSVIASSWENDNVMIMNLVDTSSTPDLLMVDIAAEKQYKYFDLWNGTELTPYIKDGRDVITLKIDEFGSLLRLHSEDEHVQKLLIQQRSETLTPLPVPDEYNQEQSIKKPLKYSYSPSQNAGFSPELLEIRGGEETFTARHIWREGRCYPNMEAAHNHDLVLTHEDGAQRILHTHREVCQDYSIMSRVVTNGQFADFLKDSGYQPRYSENFLNHWKGNTCPPELSNDPVVYVSLEDARAFANWAGMELPGEWEWQKSAMEYPESFVFNEVFEWNESERFDGYNRFVTLRGGCCRWITPSSWWYLPGGAYGEIAGGPQKFDSHVKYFLMYPGLDRASTIGFRCMKKN